MARRRRRLQWIENRTQRLVTYRKRREGLKKAANQLSSLCGVPIAVISFGPDGRLDTWPDDQGALRDLLLTYRSLDPEKRRKHDLDLPTLLGAQAIISPNLPWDPRLDAMPAESLRKLANSLESRVEAIDERIQQLLENNSKCSNQDNNNTSREQGDDSKCNDKGNNNNNNNTSSDQGDDSNKGSNESNNNTSSEQGLPPCSNPLVFDPFPINKRNALTDCYNVPMDGLGHGLDQSGRFINSSSQTFSSVPSSHLMPPPSIGTATSENNKGFGSDLPFWPLDSSFGGFFESSEFLMGGGDIGMAEPSPSAWGPLVQ
ncbi:transcription factor mef2A-like [Cocos nucifera]|uniref:Transcription factor mef2A-like n=1 Tax=Cocos nucifera TaxID=13894 RepID=A0A8K0IGS7_COCNU|nr:transcription factor mef2A-like [Cocos nucifera]